jgi:anti-sigma factor RsiW
MTTFGRHTHTDDTAELLSAYLDNALDVVERRRADHLLSVCAACAAELADLRALRSLLRELPTPMPRRSFTLDPAMVRPRPRLFPVFRIATFATALLLVVVLGVDALLPGLQQAGGQTSATSLMAPAGAETGAEQSAQRSAATTAPDAGAAAGRAGATQEDAIQAPAAVPMPQPTMAAAAAPVEPTPAAADAGAGGGSAEESMEAADAAVAATEAAITMMQEQTGQPFAPTIESPEPALSVPAGDSTAGGATGGDTAAGGAGGDTAAGGAAPSQPLANSDPAGVDTAPLDAQRAPAQPAEPVRPLRLLAYLLGALTLALGAATWWAAQRRV